MHEPLDEADTAALITALRGAREECRDLAAALELHDHKLYRLRHDCPAEWSRCADMQLGAHRITGSIIAAQRLLGDA